MVVVITFVMSEQVCVWLIYCSIYFLFHFSSGLFMISCAKLLCAVSTVVVFGVVEWRRYLKQCKCDIEDVSHSFPIKWYFYYMFAMLFILRAWILGCIAQLVVWHIHHMLYPNLYFFLLHVTTTPGQYMPYRRAG